MSMMRKYAIAFLGKEFVDRLKEGLPFWILALRHLKDYELLFINKFVNF